MKSVHDTWSSTCFTIFVGNLASEVDKEYLIKVFEQYGNVKAVDFPRAIDRNKPPGYCFIIYERWESVVLAADNLNGINIHGRIIKVQPAPRHMH